MNIREFDIPAQRQGTGCMKWDWDQKRTGRDGLTPFWVADMDFLAPPVVRQALQKRMDHGIFGYSFCPDSMMESLISWFSRRHHWEIPSQSIVEIPGIVPGIYSFIREFTQPGEAVVIQEPVYYPFRQALERNHRTVAVNNLVQNEDGQWEMDLEGLESTLQETGAKVMIFCSPHNPVGRVWKKSELMALAKVCKHYDVTVISDEIHADLVHKGPTHVPWLSLPEESLPPSLALLAPTKTFNIPGIPTAFAVIPRSEVRTRYAQALRASGYSGEASPLAYVAAESAYNQGEPWLEALLDYLAQNDAYLRERLHKALPQISLSPLEGTYLEWLNLGEAGWKDEKPVWEKLLDAGVWLSPGSDFGAAGAGHLRMNIACPKSQLEVGIEALISVLS